MENLMMAINQSWWWLGPWLLISLGIALILLIIDLIKGEIQGLGPVVGFLLGASAGLFMAMTLL